MEVGEEGGWSQTFLLMEMDYLFGFLIELAQTSREHNSPLPLSLASGMRWRSLLRSRSWKTRDSCSSMGTSAMGTPSQITEPYSAAEKHRR